MGFENDQQSKETKPLSDEERNLSLIYDKTEKATRQLEELNANIQAAEDKKQDIVFLQKKYDDLKADYDAYLQDVEQQKSEAAIELKVKQEEVIKQQAIVDSVVVTVQEKTTAKENLEKEIGELESKKSSLNLY